MDNFDMRATWLASMGLAATLCVAPVVAQAPPRTIELDFRADVQADGSLANVMPDPGLAPELQAMLRKRVAGWRYTPGTWQGTPVPQPISQRIMAEVVPTAADGVALQIREVQTIPVYLDPRRSGPGQASLRPSYPDDGRRHGIEGTLIYALRRDPQGAPIEVELVDAQLPSSWRKPFDLAGRRALRQSPPEPIEVDGEIIDCRFLTPVTFRLGLGNSPASPGPEPDLRPYLSRFPDACPLPPVLETQVAGVFL